MPTVAARAAARHADGRHPPSAPATLPRGRRASRAPVDRHGTSARGRSRPRRRRDPGRRGPRSDSPRCKPVRGAVRPVAGGPGSGSTRAPIDARAHPRPGECVAARGRRRPVRERAAQIAGAAAPTARRQSHDRRTDRRAVPRRTRAPAGPDGPRHPRQPAPPARARHGTAVRGHARGAGAARRRHPSPPSPRTRIREQAAADGAPCADARAPGDAHAGIRADRGRFAERVDWGGCRDAASGDADGRVRTRRATTQVPGAKAPAAPGTRPAAHTTRRRHIGSPEAR